MVEIINPGGPSDRVSILLATSKNNYIPNIRERQRPYDSMAAAKEYATSGHPRRVMRSLKSTYNCVGMVFASRRTCIDTDHVPMILKDDGYFEVRQLENVVIGDVALYEKDGEISHVGLVVSNELVFGAESSRQIKVLSQFGRDGEYFHDYMDIPVRYGSSVKFYSERRSGETPWLNIAL
jgi:hypothetical protein